MHWFLKVLLGLVITLLLALLVLSLPKLLPTIKISNSQVWGLIFQNQTWSGTVRVLGDTVALPTTTITLEPGTKVLVAKEGDKSNFDFLPWHLISGINTGNARHGVLKGEPFWDEGQKIQLHFGKLVAVGTQEMPIIIKSDSTFGSPYDINSITFSSGIISHANLSDYRRLEIGPRVTIRDSGLTGTGECAICISSGNPSVINNSFGVSLRQSIWISKASPRITDNLLVNLSGGGIVIDPKRVGMPVISFNDFEMPGQLALEIVSGGEENAGAVSFNKFSGNSKIGLTCDNKIRLNQNSILSLIIFGGSGCGGSYTFGANYWGVKDVKAVLSERITNKERNFEILIPAILDSPPKVFGIRTR